MTMIIMMMMIELVIWRAFLSGCLSQSLDYRAKNDSVPPVCA